MNNRKIPKKANSKASVTKSFSTLEIVTFVIALLVALYIGKYLHHEPHEGVVDRHEANKIEDIDIPPTFKEPEVDMPETSARLVPKNANAEGKPREAVKECMDRHPQCKAFYRQGECDRNPGWMIVNCPKSCDRVNNACRLRDPQVRCTREALNISTDPVYHPGDMHNMFSNIIPRFGHRYEIKQVSNDPYVFIFENFVSDDEADALIKSVSYWERSTDTGSMNEFGESGRVLSSGRTSSNSWCKDDCERNPKVRQLFRKIEEVTGVPRQNYESFQILRYELNQKYNVHHDYGEEDILLPCGPRILTFFLYLSGNSSYSLTYHVIHYVTQLYFLDVEEGGETSFPLLNVNVKPKKGRAVLWPSTLDSNPELVNPRTVHEAKPVIKGTKFAANAWIHLYDYAKPNLWGCTGSFEDI